MTDKPENNPVSNDQIDPDHSKPFDVHTWSDHPEVSRLVDNVWNALPEAIHQSLIGRSNNKGIPPKRILKVLLIDLYVTWLDDPDLCIGIARSDGAWRPTSRYNATHIPKKLNDVVDHLVEHGFLLFVGGSNDRQYGGRFSRTSRIKPSDKLHRLFADCQASEFDFSKHEETETIILNEFDIDAEGNVIRTGGRRKKKKVLQLEYTDTAETRSMRETLHAYNHLLRNTYVDISSLEQTYVIRQDTKGKTIRVPVNQRSKFVRRIFSRGEWYYNGRYYGGFWQQVGEEYRKDIRIDDVPTIEVDFKGLHPAIIAATKGVNSVGDRYSLEEGLIPRLNSDQQRDAVKLLALTAINANSRTQAFRAHVDASDIKLKHDELNVLLDAFIEHNPYLGDHICSDKGIELMYLDSQITENIIQAFIREDRPILTVHDSYVVQVQDTEYLHQQMRIATKKVLGTELQFDQDYLSYKQAKQRMDGIEEDAILPTTNTPIELIDLIPTPQRTRRYINTIRKFVNWQSEYNPTKTYNINHMEDL
jgi:hypothetical protein